MNREEAIIRLDGIDREAKELRMIINEPEEPKLRHGDFGINKDGNNRITLFRNGLGIRGKNLGGRDDYCNMGTVSDSEITIFGNIFDLMEGWGKDLTEFSVDGKLSKINFSDIICPFLIFNHWFKLSEAKEFYHKLGRMLVTYKRKENQNE